MNEARSVDPRLRLAIDASLAWYDDVFTLHRLRAARFGGLWRALAEPPPFHSVAKTIEPSVSSDRVLEATAQWSSCSVADSFGDLALPGFSLLFESQWVHIPAGSSSGKPPAWSVVSAPQTLDLWCALHDYTGVLPPAVLNNSRFTVLGRFAGEDLVGGAILHDGSPAVGLSNVWSAAGVELDWDELLSAARAVHPGRALTDYATGEDLAAMLTLGFTALGPQLVWVR